MNVYYFNPGILYQDPAIIFMLPVPVYQGQRNGDYYG